MIPDIEKIKNIMIAIPDRLGDTLFCTQIFRLLNEYYPDINIDILAPTKLSAAVLQYNPYIRTAYVLPTADAVAEIAHNYEVVIDISDSEIASGYLKFFEARRINYRSDPEVRLHTAEKVLRFFGELFAVKVDSFARHYDIFPQPDNVRNIELLLQEHGVNLQEDNLIGFHMGCHGLSQQRSRIFGRLAHNRAWPIKRFIKLAQKLQALNPKLKIVLTGSKEEKLLGEMFCKKISACVNLIEKTKVLDLAALMSKLELFVANDTGVMHIACATDIARVVALFGKSNPLTNGPYPQNKRFSVCQQPKITDITVAEVLSKIEKRC